MILLLCGASSHSLAEDKYLAFLYNDEIHSYDEVIHTLTHNVKLQHSDAVALATFVDRKVPLLSLSLSLSLTLSLSLHTVTYMYSGCLTSCVPC